MTLRKATLGDIGPMTLMARHFHKAAKIEWKFETARAQGFLRQFVPSPDTLALVVEQNGVAQGMFGASFNDHMFFSGKLAMVWGVWLEPEVRSPTAFRAIMRAFQDECAQRDVRMAVMAAQVATPRIGALFERMGFKATETHYTMVF